MKKYAMTCIFCGSDDELVEYMGKAVCADCLKKLGESN